MTNKKTVFWDKKQKLGLFLIICAILALIISLILFSSAIFIDNFNQRLGDGFWCLKNYGIIYLFQHWNELHDHAAIQVFVAYPYYQVYCGIILLMIFFPLAFGIGMILFIRGWWKTKI